MWRFAAGVSLLLQLHSVSAAGDGPTDITEADRETLAAALDRAGPSVAGLPISLASVPSPEVSKMVVAWTTYDEGGQGKEIFVYTKSRLFRCASGPAMNRSTCPLVLASVLIHEAWHLRSGTDESRAYTEQIWFLQMNKASEGVIDEVFRARLLAMRKQRAIRAARRNLYGRVF